MAVLLPAHDWVADRLVVTKRWHIVAEEFDYRLAGLPRGKSKAPRLRRSPKPGGSSGRRNRAPASWSAAVFRRFRRASGLGIHAVHAKPLRTCDRALGP